MDDMICSESGEIIHNSDERDPSTSYSSEELYEDADDNISEDISEVITDWEKYYTGIEGKVLKFIDGFIIRQLRKCDIQEDMESQWIDLVSDGGLRKPPEWFFTKLIGLETIFNSIMGDKVGQEPKITQGLVDNREGVKIEPEIEVRKLFFKGRIHARINELHTKYLHVIQSTPFYSPAPHLTPNYNLLYFSTKSMSTMYQSYFLLHEMRINDAGEITTVELLADVARPSATQDPLQYSQTWI